MLRFVFAMSLWLLLGSAAQAGTLSLADGKGEWASTACERPSIPATLPGAEVKPGEPRAKDMNQRIVNFNKYAEAGQQYINCLSEEATKDFGGAQQAVATTAQKSMDEVKAQIEALRPQPRKK